MRDIKRGPTEHGLSISIVSGRAGLASLRGEWDDLLERSASTRPFSTWTWADCWWKHHRWGRRLSILTVREGDVDGAAAHDVTTPNGPVTTPGRSGRLVGLGPFFREWIAPGLPIQRLRLIGAGNSDYLDLIIERGREDQVAEALVAHLGRPQAVPRWHLLTLEEVPGDSSALLAFRRAAERAGWDSVLLAQERCPYRELPPTWEEFRQGLGKQTRKHLDYYRRRLEKESGFAIHLVDDEAALPGAMNAFFDLHRRRWWRRGMPGSFSLPGVRRFHQDVARHFLAEGKLRLYLAEAAGHCVAAQYSFRTSAGTFYYSGGFDPAWSWAGVGSLVVADSIRRAIEEGSPVFDFLRGAENYKYRWTSTERTNFQFSAVHPGFPPQPWLRLLDLQNRLGQAIKERSH